VSASENNDKIESEPHKMQSKPHATQALCLSPANIEWISIRFDFSIPISWKERGKPFNRKNQIGLAYIKTIIKEIEIRYSLKT